MPRTASTKTKTPPRKISSKEHYELMGGRKFHKVVKARGINEEELLVAALVRQDQSYDEQSSPKPIRPEPLPREYSILDSGLNTIARRRPPQLQYNSIDFCELHRIAKVRGISPRDLMVNALVEQDNFHAKHPLPFLLLPAELRNQIYSYTLSTPAVELDVRLKLSSLARVSSQIRRESLKVFFGNNTLCLATCPHGRRAQELYQNLAPKSGSLLNKIAPHAEHLRKVLIAGCMWLKGSHSHPKKPLWSLMTLTLKRCLNRTPQYVASAELTKGYHNSCRVAAGCVHPKMDSIKESIETSVKNSAQAYLDQHPGFTFSARNINALLDALEDCARVDFDQVIASLTPLSVE